MDILQKSGFLATLGAADVSSCIVTDNMASCAARLRAN